MFRAGFPTIEGWCRVMAIECLKWNNITLEVENTKRQNQGWRVLLETKPIHQWLGGRAYLWRKRVESSCVFNMFALKNMDTDQTPVHDYTCWRLSRTYLVFSVECVRKQTFVKLPLLSLMFPPVTQMPWNHREKQSRSAETIGSHVTAEAPRSVWRSCFHHAVGRDFTGQGPSLQRHFELLLLSAITQHRNRLHRVYPFPQTIQWMWWGKLSNSFSPFQRVSLLLKTC